MKSEIMLKKYFHKDYYFMNKLYITYKVYIQYS